MSDNYGIKRTSIEIIWTDDNVFVIIPNENLYDIIKYFTLIISKS